MENYFDRKLPLLRRGPIQLQTHGGEISLEERLMVREIPPAEANKILAVQGRRGFTAIFDGKTRRLGRPGGRLRDRRRRPPLQAGQGRHDLPRTTRN